MGKEQSLETRGLRFEYRRWGFFTRKILFLKIEDKLSSKNLSPEIAVNYCKTVQVSVAKSWMTGKINLELANR